MKQIALATLLVVIGGLFLSGCTGAEVAAPKPPPSNPPQETLMPVTLAEELNSASPEGSVENALDSADAVLKDSGEDLAAPPSNLGI